MPDRHEPSLRRSDLGRGLLPRSTGMTWFLQHKRHPPFDEKMSLCQGKIAVRSVLSPALERGVGFPPVSFTLPSFTVTGSGERLWECISIYTKLRRDFH